MKDFLNQDICIEDKRLCTDEPMDAEEFAALYQLLGKFSDKCASMGEQLDINRIRAMVADAAAREV